MGEQGNRDEVLAYARERGAAVAAEKYSVSAGTIRSWRSRAGGATAAIEVDEQNVEPGQDSYVVAATDPGAVPAALVHQALEQAEAHDTDRGAKYIGVSRVLVEAWIALDQGETPGLLDRDAEYRLTHAIRQLPVDLRAEIVLSAEQCAWNYLAEDLRHHRLRAERQAEEAAEAAETARQQRAEQAERDRIAEEQQAEADRAARDQREQERQAREQERQRQAELAEQHRRQSEQQRRQAA